MSETQISSLKRFQPQPEEPNTRLDNEKNDKKDVLPSKSKLITISSKKLFNAVNCSTSLTDRSFFQMEVMNSNRKWHPTLNN